MSAACESKLAPRLIQSKHRLDTRRYRSYTGASYLPDFRFPIEAIITSRGFGVGVLSPFNRAMLSGSCIESLGRGVGEGVGVRGAVANLRRTTPHVCLRTSRSAESTLSLASFDSGSSWNSPSN